MQHPQTLFAMTTFALVAACATVSDQTIGMITVDGVNYTTITRTFDQNGQITRTGAVRFAGVSYGCDTTRPGSCEAVIRRLRDVDINRQSGGNSMNSSSFIIPGVN